MAETNQPAGGRGAVKAAFDAFSEQGIPLKVVRSFLKANKPEGFDCPGCAFPDRPGSFGPDSCEQGQKAIAWEMTPRKADAAFFAQHTLTELRQWRERDIEAVGRLTEPLRYNAQTDRYEPIAWVDALQLAATELRALEPTRVSFYTSGRASNEAAFLWQLLARAYGSANLPDSSNLCHEPSGLALKEQIGVGKGTAQLSDFELADCILVVGQNPATNHPRLMGTLHAASKRGATVLAMNPLVERGFVNFADPKDVGEMLTNTGHRVAKTVYTVKVGGDLAALKGVAKRWVELEAQGQSIFDLAFIREHCEGFEALLADLRGEDWQRIEADSGLSREALHQLADELARSRATLITWCMGLTHHEDAVATIQTLVNLQLLRGMIGKPGTGVVPVRGHSNVQGDRTMGCTFAVPERWIANQEATLPGLRLTRERGLDALGTAQGLLDGSLQGLLSLGGNFAVAGADAPAVLAALSRTPFTLHIATKPNRTHLHPGRTGLLLPCLARTDIDRQDGHEQRVSVEDSMSMVHASKGMQTPLSNEMRSEPAIVAQLGHALLHDGSVPWLHLIQDYDRIRALIERCQQGVFEGFENFNAKLQQPGGFWLPNAAARREWRNAGGRAKLMPHALPTEGVLARAKAGLPASEHARVLSLMTVRSHDQFNTTVYGQDDRYRNVFGTREVVFLSPAEITRLGLHEGQKVDVEGLAIDDGQTRWLRGFEVRKLEMAPGCAAAYFPEATPLVPTGLVAKGARTPAAKALPVRLHPVV
ncbi:molybdopterin-dependent oxidoreductase alpha subunit [Inhella inkyongensis]|uniref:Molybdopterin-dependent oxidoreductase alpha subunit n=1 Tax=Inhella inkyongensis TaxID=392593 RepID=A0A840RZY8_9BURK|nr:FdhF/YdeP family oxidoreductase [Inhella inkyongensis]MBB5203113.1 molybdopterin-dependent oxidoreductase alpha subunit [Inhella inkyongensis]